MLRLLVVAGLFIAGWLLLKLLGFSVVAGVILVSLAMAVLYKEDG